MLPEARQSTGMFGDLRTEGKQRGLMGKVIITARVSADLSIGPSMGWFEGRETGAEEQAADDEFRRGEAMLLGRRTYQAISAHWLPRTDEFAARVNSMPKYVVSTSLTGPLDWNATLVEGDLVDEVRKLKSRHDGNLLSYGCGTFAYELVRHGLADEIHFWVYPVVWNDPERPFHGLGRVAMHLRSSTVFSSGVVLQNYRPVSIES